MKKKLAIVLCAGLILGCCAAPLAGSLQADAASRGLVSGVKEKKDNQKDDKKQDDGKEAGQQEEEKEEETSAFTRPTLLGLVSKDKIKDKTDGQGEDENPDTDPDAEPDTEPDENPDEAGAPCVPEYFVEEDLSNVINAEEFSYFPEEALALLVENGFFVMGTGGGGGEFFEVYEDNRYLQRPNFITVDSMLHTYHLYFAHLLRQTEKNDLVYRLQAIGEDMLEISAQQAEELAGTEWEDAALLNEAFFAVGVKLLDPDAELPKEVGVIAEDELALIEEQGGISMSPMFEEFEDYTQYKPRGYYEGDETLEQYFRAMMWYGRRNFIQTDELKDRSALLMCLALNEGPIEDWEALYTVTSFFAGTSDDSGYFEYLPLIEEAYGGIPEIGDLPGTKQEFRTFHKLTGELEPPAINSVPMADDDGETDKAEVNKGFRFIGQRFTLDAAIFQQLCYSKVKKNENEEKRLLPTALDIPAAMGSEAALDLIRYLGMDNYPNYDEQLDFVRERISNAPEESHQVSLYAGWLDTLTPLLTEKGEGYPFFMQNTAWTEKCLETYLGSWTELKHDTVLYSKQFMAEMGGGPEEEVDDRGYVEPEPEVYARLAALTQKTCEGLQYYDMISEEDAANLEILAELAGKLQIIAEKELQDITPSEEEFELIKTYGGQLEHLWADSIRDQMEDDETRPDSRLFPPALVVDVATDPNGSVLEVACGNPSTIYVAVPVDGKIRIASGSVYNYYEFVQPIDERLTDSEWRRMIGAELNDDNTYEKCEIEKPDWTMDYRAVWNY